MKKFPVIFVSYKCAEAAADALGAGLNVAVTLVPGAGIPGAPGATGDIPGAPGGIPPGGG